MGKISVPSSWSTQDVQGFLKFIKPDSEDKEVRENLLDRPQTRHCWKNGGCQFWRQDGAEEYQGHCGLYSCACAAAVFDRKSPPWWLPK